MSKRKHSRLFKFILNTATVASVCTLIACVFSLESNSGSWTPVWFAVAAFFLFVFAEWMRGE